MRKVFYVTGTRADFGLMRRVLEMVHGHPQLTLQVAVTGMHLIPEFGSTVREIEASGLPIVARVPTSVGERTPLAMARGIGELVIGLTQALSLHQPDLMLLIGDRGEMLAGAIAALHFGIPIVHLHGGERSGTVDEPVRHAITKLSHWHFVATDESRTRVLQMGERPADVWVTGAPSLDHLQELEDLPRPPVLDMLQLPQGASYLLVLFHPIVQEAQSAYQQTQLLAHELGKLVAQTALHVVWLAPNADGGSGEIVRALDELQETFGAVLHRIVHLPRDDYLAALRHADLLIGNSSSGIIEAASLGTPVVNIGNRQRARERNVNTQDCPVESESIRKAIGQALSNGRFAPANRYGDGHAAERIVELLATQPIRDDLLDKINTY
jgi:GDP/UDP-N,N'-diacetylbacillosamine 2-epimerase (hydrolysing)